MPLIKWDERFSVGIETLDNDHKKLVQMLNDLYDQLTGELGPETLEKTFDSLVEYITFHFKREEEYFARTGYSQAVAHSQEHARMTAWVGQMLQRLQRGETSGMTLEALDYLRDWLFDHILGTDRLYTECFLQHKIR